MGEKALERYQGASGQAYHRAKRAIPEEAFPWIARLRAEKLAAYVEPDHTVLEYGVGLGWNLVELTCARKVGLDVGEFLEREVRRHGIEFVTNPESLPDEAFDVVVCHHTLEHVANPPAVLATIRRVLRREGRLLLFVPFEKESRYRRFDPAEPNHHLYSWNVQTLGNLVADAGFVIEDAGIAAFGQERFAALMSLRLRLGEAGFRGLRWLANTLKNEKEVRLRAIRAG